MDKTQINDSICATPFLHKQALIKLTQQNTHMITSRVLIVYRNNSLTNYTSRVLIVYSNNSLTNYLFVELNWPEHHTMLY